MYYPYRRKLFKRLIYLAFTALLMFSGCTSTGNLSDIYREFSRLEERASSYGTVTAGAVRITDYDIYNAAVSDSRTAIINGLIDMQGEIMKAGIKNTVAEPEGYELTKRQKKTKLRLNVNKSNMSDNDKLQLHEQLDKLIEKDPKPNPIARIGFRLAAAKEC